jgi:serine/threonine-protein kinase
MTEPTQANAAAASETSKELVGRVGADRFRVDELIGTGAMGAVYRALHVHTRKQVALKVLHRELTGVEEVVARFEREAVAAGRVEHPHVAGALDFGRLADGTFYLVLEYVAGERLRSVRSSARYRSHARSRSRSAPRTPPASCIAT